MKVSRETSIHIQRLMDEVLPPFIRDSKIFMYIPMKIVVGKHARTFMDFKDTGFAMSEKEFSGVYEKVADVSELQGETDLNERCTAEILRSAQGKNVLEVGCGRGYLAGKLAKNHVVTATDIIVPDKVKEKYSNVKFLESNIEKLPFADNSFETVVTTHTLEHVQDIHAAIAELRRVAKSRLIVVVPRQRPYKYNFSLHLNYFPYSWSFPGNFGYHAGSSLVDLGDWLYIENY